MIYSMSPSLPSCSVRGAVKGEKVTLGLPTSATVSSASGFKSSTLRSTARMAHREPEAASSSIFTVEPGSARSLEKAIFTWGRTGEG